MRYLVRRTPTHNVLAWQKAMERFFDEDFSQPARFTGDSTGWNPLALDISEDDNSLTIEASLPGIHPDNVDISVHDGVLTIKGDVETKEETETTEGESKYHLRERRYGAFQRAVRLPVEVNADSAEAVFENGVLHLTLPKVEEAKPKRIAVKAS